MYIFDVIYKLYTSLKKMWRERLLEIKEREAKSIPSRVL
jgi:hypothetical protein